MNLYIILTAFFITYNLYNLINGHLHKIILTKFGQLKIELAALGPDENFYIEEQKYQLERKQFKTLMSYLFSSLLVVTAEGMLLFHLIKYDPYFYPSTIMFIFYVVSFFAGTLFVKKGDTKFSFLFEAQLTDIQIRKQYRDFLNHFAKNNTKDFINIFINLLYYSYIATVFAGFIS